MNKFYLLAIIIAVIIASIFIITFALFGYILYNKYIYLFKVIRKMENDKYLWPLTKKISNGITNYVDKKGKTLLIGVGNCTVLESLVKKLSAEFSLVQQKPKKEKSRDIKRVEEELSDLLTAQVEVRVKKRVKRHGRFEEMGELSIQFGSLDELNGLIDKLRG